MNQTETSAVIPLGRLYASGLIGKPGEYEIEIRSDRKTESGSTDSHVATIQSSRMPDALQDHADEIVNRYNAFPELVNALQSALRYIEVHEAYRGAMTADEVEKAILESKVATVSIGANSCNTLASFDIANARKLLSTLTTSLP